MATGMPLVFKYIYSKEIVSFLLIIPLAASAYFSDEYTIQGYNRIGKWRADNYLKLQAYPNFHKFNVLKKLQNVNFELIFHFQKEFSLFQRTLNSKEF